MRGVIRTLDVLRALNVRNGATVLDLSRATGISRPALYRVLETLRDAGYVALDLSGQHYCLTMQVRGLANGFTDEDNVVEVARPALRKLQKHILWPADLATFMDNSIWLRETTRPYSPLTIDRWNVGLRCTLIRSAAGRTFLAFCPDDAREQILANVLRAHEDGHELVADRPSFDRMLQRVRDLGYGARYGEEPLESGAIAVPIRTSTRILGCVTVTFMRRVLSLEEVAEKCLQPMVKTAAAIASGVEANNGRSSSERWAV